MQKKNFSHILPGFRLFELEPPSEMPPGIICSGVNDARTHLTQIFYRYSLPFQKVVLHQPPPVMPASQQLGSELDFQEQEIKPITLVFLKSQHSFRHLSIAQKFQRRPSKPESVQAGCMKELGDLELRMLSHSYLEALYRDQAQNNPY